MVLFKKNIKTTDAASGNRIKFLPVNKHFSDVFDSEDTFLPNIESVNKKTMFLEQGQIPIGDSLANCLTIMEFPTTVNPPFGDSELYDLELNIYSKDLDYNEHNILPDWEIYNFKDNIPSDLGGPALDLATPNFLISSGYYGTMSTLDETFTGTDDTYLSNVTMPSLFSAGALGSSSHEKMYMTIADAWLIDEAVEGYNIINGNGLGDSSNCHSQDEYFRRYGTTHPILGDIVKLKTSPDRGGHFVAPEKAAFSWTDLKDDPEYYRPMYDMHYAKAIGEYDEYFEQHLIHNTDEGQINIPEEGEGDEDPTKNVRFLKRAAFSNTNTTFNYTASTDNKSVYEVGGEQTTHVVSQNHFSTLGTPSNGQSARMLNYSSSYISLHKHNFNWGNNEKQGYSTCMAYKIIPKPITSSRLYADTNNMASQEINIRFQVENLTKMAKFVATHETGGETDVDGTSNQYWYDVKNSNYDWGQNDYIDQNSLSRSIVFMVASRPPRSDETFGEYIHRMNTGDLDSYEVNAENANKNPDGTVGQMYIYDDYQNPKDTRFDSSSGDSGTTWGERGVNQYNAIALMRVPEYKTSEDLSKHVKGEYADGSTMYDTHYYDHPEDRTDGRNNRGESDGEIRLFHSGLSADDTRTTDWTGRINFWDGYFYSDSNKSPQRVADFNPFVIKMGMRGRVGTNVYGATEKATNPLNSGGIGDKRIIDPYGEDRTIAKHMPHPASNSKLGPSADNIGSDFTTGEWYTLKIIINTEDKALTYLRGGTLSGHGVGTVSWFIMDKDDNIVGSRLNQLHSGGWQRVGGDTAVLNSRNDGAFYPDCLSIWVNNQPVGIGSLENDFGNAPDWNYEPIGKHFFFNEPTNSSTSLLLDYITVNSYKNNIDNGSIVPLKQGTAAKLSIDSSEPAATAFQTNVSFASQENGSKMDSWISHDNPYLYSSANSFPSYLTWGFEIGRGADDTFTNPTSGFMDYSDKTDYELFLGGFETASPTMNDGNDRTKRPKYDEDSFIDRTDGLPTTDMYFFYPRSEQPTGQWLHHLRRGVSPYKSNTRPYINDCVKLDGINRVDNFTKKGFISFNRNDLLDTVHPNVASDEKWYPRENPLYSVKITKIVNKHSGIVEVDDPNLLRTFEDDELIIYRTGYTLTDGQWTANTGSAACSPFIRRRIKLDPDYYHASSGRLGQGNKIRLSNLDYVTLTQPDNKTMRIYGADTYHPDSTHNRDGDEHIILNEKYISELYISPLRYWVAAEIYNQSEQYDEILPYKKYNHAVLFKASNNVDNLKHGPTFTETKYSDTSAYSNRWSITKNSANSLIDTKTDYGFGAYSDSDDFVSRDSEIGAGYINKIIPKEGLFNKISLKGYVDANQKKITSQYSAMNFVISASEETSGVGTFLTPKHEDKGAHPYMTYIFNDNVPVIEEFSVEPDKDTEYYPTFKWACKDNDLWYGFLILDDTYIDNQYHSAVLHLPFNESDALDNGKFWDSSEGVGMKGYRHDGVNKGTSFDIHDKDWTLPFQPRTAQGLMVTEEGLAGNALLFHGLDDSSDVKDMFGNWKGHTSSRFRSMIESTGKTFQGFENQVLEIKEENFTQPTSEMSIVTHFTVRSLGDTLGGVGAQTNDRATILDKYQEYKLWIDSSGYVHYRQYFSSSGYIDLKSSTLVPVDDYIPTNVIITFDGGLSNGNVKMFVNGNLESQTGNKLTTGDTNHWQSGNINVYNPATLDYDFEYKTRLRIGCEKEVTGSQSGRYHGPFEERFNGKLEEIVIYNKTIYPIVPQNNEYTLVKPFRELSVGDTAISKDIIAKLFIKDYHNIRGKTNADVASSSAIVINKAGVGLKTN